MIVIAIACWLGVFVAEAGEAWLLAQGWNRGLQGTLEEGLEIIGSTLFLIALIELFPYASATRTRSTPSLPRAEGGFSPTGES